MKAFKMVQVLIFTSYFVLENGVHIANSNYAYINIGKTASIYQLLCIIVQLTTNIGTVSITQCKSLYFQTGATGQDLYNTISEHLGLTETIFFGLMIIKGKTTESISQLSFINNVYCI